MARGRIKPREEHSIEGTELNLVPYLDIMVNLIMFMLLTFQVSLELRLIPYNPPAVDDKTVIGSKPKIDSENPLLLTVSVTNAGFKLISTDESILPAVEIPLKADKTQDFTGLGQALQKARKGSPQLDEHLIVVAEPNVVYNVIVQTLDATRDVPGETCELSTKKGCLFPNVTLALPE